MQILQAKVLFQLTRPWLRGRAIPLQLIGSEYPYRTGAWGDGTCLVSTVDVVTGSRNARASATRIRIPHT